MATNPMQRQARNSFLLGMIITLIIAGVIVYLLFSQMKKLNKELKDERSATVEVYVAKKDIKSGQTITAYLFEKRLVKSNGVPEDATSDIHEMIATYSLCDKSGNNIKTDSDGKLYMETEDGGKTTVYIDDATGDYYTQTTTNETKNYIETTQKPLIAKVNLKANTVVAGSFIARSDEMTTDDVRQQEYNMLVLPIDVVTGDFVDVRLQMPTGQDFIVISKKKVTVPEVNGEYLTDTIQMNLAEEEIISMSNAIVEAYKMEGSKLYVTKYTEAGMQEASTPTYAVSDSVAKLIDLDPNIVKKARTELSNRYNNGSLKELRRQYIDGAVSNYGKDENVSTKMTESITSTQEARKQYLQSLTGTAAN